MIFIAFLCLLFVYLAGCLGVISALSEFHGRKANNGFTYNNLIWGWPIIFVVLTIRAIRERVHGHH